MKFDMSVNADNDAFQDPDELPRILRQIATQIERGRRCGPVLDINGNTVGSWVIK